MSNELTDGRIWSLSRQCKSDCHEQTSRICLWRQAAEAEAERITIEDARLLYDLQQAPLMRAKLVTLADADYVFILHFHHIVTDGSSLAIFYQQNARGTLQRFARRKSATLG